MKSASPARGELGLILLEARPDKMSGLNELLERRPT